MTKSIRIVSMNLMNLEKLSSIGVRLSNDREKLSSLEELTAFPMKKSTSRKLKKRKNSLKMKRVNLKVIILLRRLT